MERRTFGHRISVPVIGQGTWNLERSAPPSPRCAAARSRQSGRIAHVEENAGAGSLTLTPEELLEIDRAFPLGRKPSSLPMI